MTQIQTQIDTLSTVASSSSSTNALGRWTLLKQLGSGATAKVFLAVDNEAGQRAAIKIFTAEARISHELLRIESYVLQKLSHANVLRFVEAHESIEFYDFITGQVCLVSALVMEYAAGGEFFDMLETMGSLSEDFARFYFKQIIEALDHMHKKNIAHRDIKLENILIDERQNIKLADFGYSSPISSNGLFTHAVGTSTYFTPEIHAGQAFSGESADLFAAGMILFSMVSGHMPFAKATSSDRVYSLFYNNGQETFWTFHEKMAKKNNSEFEFSANFKDLINKMFEPNTNKRANMDDILNHPWTQGKSN